jgi:hypothetical protein
MVTSKFQKISVTFIILLSVLNLLPYTDWEYHLFFNSKQMVIDERVKPEVNEVVKEFYKRGVPLHQICEESFLISVDDCMLPNLWGIAEGAGIPNKVFISLNKDIIKTPKEFRKWVIAHEFAHELGYFHDDDLMIMWPFFSQGYDKALNELTTKILEKNLVN